MLFDTANDSTISIKLFLADNNFQKYDFIAEVFLSEQRAWQSETCPLHFVPHSVWPFTLPQYLLESWTSSCMPPDRDSLQYVLDVRQVQHFKFLLFYPRISLKLFLRRLRGYCFVSLGVSVLPGKAEIRGRPFLSWMKRFQPVQSVYFCVTRTRKRLLASLCIKCCFCIHPWRKIEINLCPQLLISSYWRD